MSAKKVFGFILVLLAVVWALAWWSSQLSLQRQTVNLKQFSNQPEVIQVTIIINNGQTQTTYPLSLTAASSVLEALQKIDGLLVTTKDYGQLGVLVNGIGDQFNGQDGRYWQYWLNGAYSLIGADKQILKANDVVEWKFLTEQQVQ